MKDLILTSSLSLLCIFTDVFKVGAFVGALGASRILLGAHRVSLKGGL